MRAMKALSFDPARYPRTYKPWLPLRIVVGLLGVLVILGSTAKLATGLVEHSGPVSLQEASSALSALVGGAAAFIVTASLLRARVRLMATSLELRTLWTTRHVQRDDILDAELFGDRRIGGFRVNARTLAQTLSSSMPLGADDAFRAWFAGLPASASIESARNLQAIAADPRLGATPDARLAAAASARRAVRPISWVVVGLLAWTAFYPHPRMPLLVALAACPWLLAALCWRSNGLFSLAAHKNSGRGELIGAYLLAIVALGLRAMADVTLARGSTVVLWSLVATGSMAALLFAACLDLRRSTFAGKLGHLTLLLAYACSALVLANREFDAAPGAAQAVTVVARHITGSRTATRYLKLAPTPPDMASPEIEVSSDFYSRTQVGDRLCLVEHEGALGWHWFALLRSPPRQALLTSDAAAPPTLRPTTNQAPDRCAIIRG